MITACIAKLRFLPPLFPAAISRDRSSIALGWPYLGKMDYSFVTLST
ncbi:hypothetical protein [Chlorogloeopsis fritschii]|nr:hypothetical protein [Chlorogloeopsis fritschii]